MRLPYSRKCCALGTALALAVSAHAQVVDTLAPIADMSGAPGANPTEPRSGPAAGPGSAGPTAPSKDAPEVMTQAGNKGAENGSDGSVAADRSVDNSPSSSGKAPMAASQNGSTGQSAPDVSPDWAQRGALPLQDTAIRVAVREALAGTAQPRMASGEAFRVDRNEKLSATFDAARRPGCLQPGGLKHQWTGPFAGILALPFVVVAAVRGKCG
jgi:hypothetical protein